MIAIIDYGMGNLGSIDNILKKIGSQGVVTSSKSDIASAKKLILPGVGSFGHAMRKLSERGFVDLLAERVLRHGIPILGICLGMQLFTNSSEEGGDAGLGWIDAETVRFQFDGDEQRLRIPHMGWNTICTLRESPLLNGFSTPPRFYFVHSYHVRCNDPADVLSTAKHGIEFHAAISRTNIYGVQFHPEKSHKYGMQVIRNFAEL